MQTNKLKHPISMNYIFFLFHTFYIARLVKFKYRVKPGVLSHFDQCFFMILLRVPWVNWSHALVSRGWTLDTHSHTVRYNGDISVLLVFCPRLILWDTQMPYQTGEWITWNSHYHKTPWEHRIQWQKQVYKSSKIGYLLLYWKRP